MYKVFFSHKLAITDPKLISVGLTKDESYVVFTHVESDTPLYKDSIFVGEIEDFLMRAEQFNR